MVKVNGTLKPLHSYWDSTLKAFKDINAPLSQKDIQNLFNYRDELMQTFPEKIFTN